MSRTHRKLQRYEITYASYKYNEPHIAHYLGRCNPKNVARNFIFNIKDYTCYVISIKEL